MAPPQAQLTAVSLHPGVIGNSGLFRNVNTWWAAILGPIVRGTMWLGAQLGIGTLCTVAEAGRLEVQAAELPVQPGQVG